MNEYYELLHKLYEAETKPGIGPSEELMKRFAQVCSMFATVRYNRPAVRRTDWRRRNVV